MKKEPDSIRQNLNVNHFSRTHDDVKTTKKNPHKKQKQKLVEKKVSFEKKKNPKNKQKEKKNFFFQK